MVVVGECRKPYSAPEGVVELPDGVVARKGYFGGLRVFEGDGCGILGVDGDLVGDRRHEAVEVDRLVHIVEVDRIGYALDDALE